MLCICFSYAVVGQIQNVDEMFSNICFAYSMQKVELGPEKKKTSGPGSAIPTPTNCNPIFHSDTFFCTSVPTYAVAYQSSF